MVSFQGELNQFIGCLMDGTRRQMLMRLFNQPMTVSDLAKPYGISKSALWSHLRVLEEAKLVRKTRKGKKIVINLDEKRLTMAWEYFKVYDDFMNAKLDNLEKDLLGEVNKSMFLNFKEG